MNEKARKGKFKVAWLPGEFDGYMLEGPADTWNGHPQPMFEAEEVWRIVSAIYDTVKPVLTDIDKGQALLYPLGSQSWEWEEVE